MLPQIYVHNCQDVKTSGPAFELTSFTQKRDIMMYESRSANKDVEVVPKKISDDQVLEKIRYKAIALTNIIMKIPFWPSVSENE